MAAAEAKRMRPADVLTPRDFENPPVRNRETLFEYGRHCDLYSNSLKASTQAAGVQVLVKMQKPKLRRCPDGKHILRNLPAHPNIVQFMGYVNRDGPKALVAIRKNSAARVKRICYAACAAALRATQSPR
jgi:hypothetical protein